LLYLFGKMFLLLLQAAVAENQAAADLKDLYQHHLNKN
jgi:hypothetical protein